MSIRAASRAASLGLGLLVLVAIGPAAAGQGEALPVPRVTIYPGDVIGDELLVEREIALRDGSKGHVHTARQGLVGKVARQTLLPGQPVSVNAVREPHLVKQGQAVTVVFESGSLVISSTAVSLQPGVAGDLISLRNTDSGTTIKGVVQANGSIRLETP